MQRKNDLFDFKQNDRGEMTNEARSINVHLRFHTLYEQQYRKDPNRSLDPLPSLVTNHRQGLYIVKYSVKRLFYLAYLSARHPN